MSRWANGREVLTDPRVSPVLWDDVLFPATAVNPPGAEADPDWDMTNVGWLFDASGTEVLQIIAQLPHRYAEGGDIYPHVHWQPTTTNTGNVLWRLEYRWLNNGETAGSWTTADLTVAANGTAYTYQIDTWEPFSKANAEISSMLDIKLSRVGGSDTYTGEALLKEFDIHYPVDSMGSDEITSKS